MRCALSGSAPPAGVCMSEMHDGIVSLCRRCSDTLDSHATRRLTAAGGVDWQRNVEYRLLCALGGGGGGVAEVAVGECAGHSARAHGVGLRFSSAESFRDCGRRRPAAFSLGREYLRV